LHGAGLFETIRAEHGRVFRLDQHLERLGRSAAKLLTPLPEGVLPDARTLDELLQRNALDSARIRLTVTAGQLRSDQEDDTGPTIVATASPLSGYPAQLYDQGVSVVVCSYRTSESDPTAGHKTTSYFPRLLGLREAQQARCTEAIWFTTSKHLAEGCISNVFVVRGGVIKTPPLDTPVLPGIARRIVLDIAKECSLKAEETPLGIDDLLDAQEVFLTNSMMQVMPVIRVELRDIGGARVGEVTRRLLLEYRKVIEKECPAP
jgi:branched-chain amino acid aminotransferase